MDESNKKLCSYNFFQKRDLKLIGPKGLGIAFEKKIQL